MDARRTETPRAADSIGLAPPSARLAPVDPVQSGPDGGGQIGDPEFMTRNDELGRALAYYEAAQPGFRGAEKFALTLAARALGWSGQSGDRLLDWSRLRVADYRAAMAATVRGFARAISQNRRIGE